MNIVFAQFYSHQVTPDYDELAAILRQRGHDAWVGTPSATSGIEWWRGDEKIASQERPNPWTRFLTTLVRPVAERLQDYRFIWRVRRFLNDQRPDIIQVNPASVHGIWLLPLAKPRSMHFVIDWRQIGEPSAGGRLEGMRRAWTSFRRQIITRLFYDHACFLHEAGAKRVLGANWRTCASIVPLGVDRQFLELSPNSVLEKEPGDPVRFLYIGTLSRVRRLERLLQAASIARSVSPAFQMDFIGPNRSDDYYINLIEELGLQETVYFRSPVSYHAVPETVMQYDVAFAIVPEEPADWQYHPTLKVLEYRALGIPIIATDVAPNRDVVLPGCNGVLVSNDPSAIASAMLGFVMDQTQLTEAKSAALRMREGYAWEQIVDVYQRDVYNKIVPATIPSRAEQPLRY